LLAAPAESTREEEVYYIVCEFPELVQPGKGSDVSVTDIDVFDTRDLLTDVPKARVNNSLFVGKKDEFLGTTMIFLESTSGGRKYVGKTTQRIVFSACQPPTNHPTTNIGASIGASSSSSSSSLPLNTVPAAISSSSSSSALL
jgi:hypothetical protein